MSLGVNEGRKFIIFCHMLLQTILVLRVQSAFPFSSLLSIFILFDFFSLPSQRYLIYSTVSMLHLCSSA